MLTHVTVFIFLRIDIDEIDALLDDVELKSSPEKAAPKRRGRASRKANSALAAIDNEVDELLA